MAVRAVLFDLGDTLMFKAHDPNERELYERMAARVRPLLEAWGSRTIDAPSLLRDLYGAVDAALPRRRAQGAEVDGAFITRGALSASGVEVSEEQATAFWDATFLGFQAWGWQLFPDTTDTLRRLRALGLPVAIVSNGRHASRVTAPAASDIGITAELAHPYVSSADMLLAKPSPEPFLAALDALAVEARDAVFVGDNLEADIGGAKPLGMTTVWKLNGRQEVPPAPDADFTIHDLWELFTLDLLPESSVREQSLTPHEDSNANRY